MDTKNKNEKILLIGFILIIIVALLTIFKINILNIKISKTAEKKSQLQISKKNFYDTTSAEDLQKQILLNKNKITLIDIRPFSEYINEHIIDTINIPIDEFPIAKKIDIEKTIFIIGSNSSDNNIEKAATSLRDEKIDNFKVLAGGMESWKNLIGITVNYGNPNSFTDQLKVSYTEPDQLKSALDQNVSVFILDIRSNEDFNQGHIFGAKNIPLEDLEKRRHEISTIPKILISGANELQEFQAGVQLYDMNSTSIFILKGAITEWQKRNYGLVK